MNEVILHPSALVFAALTLAGGLLAVTLRNILHAIFGLAVALLGLAGLFVYLGSPFLGAMEVLIYIGGISVAMVFAVMFAYTLGTREGSDARRWLGLLPPVALFAVLGGALRTRAPALAVATEGAESRWAIAAVGRLLLEDYNLVFEALSVALLLAIVGAIVIARPEKEAP